MGDPFDILMIELALVTARAIATLQQQPSGASNLGIAQARIQKR